MSIHETNIIANIKEEITREFEINVCYMTWYVKVGTSISHEIIKYATARGLFSTIEHYDDKTSEYEILVVSKENLEGDNSIIEQIRYSMNTPFCRMDVHMSGFECKK